MHFIDDMFVIKNKDARERERERTIESIAIIANITDSFVYN